MNSDLKSLKLKAKLKAGARQHRHSSRADPGRRPPILMYACLLPEDLNAAMVVTMLIIQQPALQCKTCRGPKTPIAV